MDNVYSNIHGGTENQSNVCQNIASNVLSITLSTICLRLSHGQYTVHVIKD